jgi:rod shape-determining protein MreB
MLKLSKRLGIDLGTANSLVYLVGEGIVLNEPTVVAVSLENNRVVAVGNEAKEMLGRTPANIVASRPMRDGVIADYAVTEAMLRFFLDRVCGPSRLFKPEVMVCVPAGVTSVERRAVLDATLSAGAKVAYLIDGPLAAAIGAKIPIATPSGNMIVDIGGGATEAAVISLGGVVAFSSVRVAGNRIDEAIASYVRRKYDLIIGERMAEEVKMAVGNAMLDEHVAHGESHVVNRVKTIDHKVSGANKPQAMSQTIDVRGRDAIAGLPKTIKLTEEEVNGAIQTPLRQIMACVKDVLEKTPPELSSDIIDKGIVLSGGTSLLRNIDRLLTLETGVACHVAEEPMLCSVLGTGIALENIDLYKRSITPR